jgi:hypothetical protein
MPHQRHTPANAELKAPIGIGSGDRLGGKRVVSEETRQKIRMKLLGRKLSIETREKIRLGALKSLKNGRRINMAGASKAWEAHRGSHGFGRLTRGRIDHARAKHFLIRSPLGDVYEVKNLAEWCRSNVGKFLPDDHPYSKTPLNRRAQVGFSMLVTGKRNNCSWRGWTAVCVFDIEADPLARRVALPPNIRS